MSNYNITDIEAVNEQPDQNRRFAERLLTRLDRNQGFSWEQVASFSKWLTASLLAVNGAGGLAALSLLKEGGGSWLPAVLFGVGLLMALLSGTALQHFYNAMDNGLNRRRARRPPRGKTTSTERQVSEIFRYSPRLWLVLGAQLHSWVDCPSGGYSFCRRTFESCLPFPRT
jgi:hypothetical protein